MQPVFTSLAATPGKEITNGVTMRFLSGEHVMLNYVEMKPHVEVATHHHPHEQLGLVFEGELTLRIGDEERILRPGDMYVVPSGIPHGAYSGGSRVLAVEVFYPLREDYLKLLA